QSTSGPRQDRPWTSNNPTGKSRIRLDSGRMAMENEMYRTRCVVHEKVSHIEVSSHAVTEEVISLNKVL
ncbi:hypothetical protein AVEN_221022-1, partial [Araneus ventricosus]